MERDLLRFERDGIPLLRVLTDRGTEYCGWVESHAYPLYLAIEDIDHSKTKARHPKPTASALAKPVEGIRIHRTLKQAFYNLAFRKKLYHSVEELQTDLDECLHQ